MSGNEHNPWSDPRFHADHLHGWIMNIDAALLGNETSKPRHRLLTDEMVQSLAAKRADGTLAHNFHFLSYVMPGERGSFLRFLGVVEALYPDKLEQFKKLLTPLPQQCPWAKDPWKHPDFLAHHRTWLLDLEPGLLRTSALRCSLLTAPMQSSLAEIDAAGAGNAAACNSQLLAFIAPGEMDSFKGFLRVLGDLGYERRRKELEQLVPAAERGTATVVTSCHAQSQPQKHTGQARKRDAVETTATAPAIDSSQPAKRKQEAESPPQPTARPFVPPDVSHPFREVNPWAHRSFLQDHYTWAVTIFPTDLRLEALNADMISLEQAERLEAREADGQDAHNSELIHCLRAGEATSFQLFVDILRKLRYERRADHMQNIMDAMKGGVDDVPAFRLYNPWKHDEFKRTLHGDLLKGDADSYRKWSTAKRLISKHGHTHLCALSDKGRDKHNDKLLTLLYPGEIDSFRTFLEVVKLVFPQIVHQDILPPMERLLDAGHV